jgi:serine/threonine protein kinase
MVHPSEPPSPGPPSPQPVYLTELEHIALLGVGGFGKVTLVRLGGKQYALKALSKAFIVEQNLVAHTRREKAAMLGCDHPFLVSLLATLQDDKYIYMLMEAVLGAELFAYMQVGRHCSHVPGHACCT